MYSTDSAWPMVSGSHQCNLWASVAIPPWVLEPPGELPHTDAWLALREADSVAQRWGLCVKLWKLSDDSAVQSTEGTAPYQAAHCAAG